MIDCWIKAILKNLMMTMMIKKKKPYRQASKNSSRENVMFVEKLVTKVQIVGLWKQTRINDLKSLS